MKTIAIIFCLIAGAVWTCQKTTDIEPAAAEVIEKKAILVYELPVDGCSWHFSIDNGDESSRFAPTEASEKKVREFAEKSNLFQTGLMRAEVKIRYQITGKSRTIECGFGAKVPLEEIDVLDIALP
ncbi:hypothetical protein GCM10023189_02580 [Nibrella saemangeumensis]|uniref:Proteinase inhibitor I42 chagasin domain-containing protein n=1 Tax=Nibrella saemangeumensis TaxID=1084526 RepID=A0ABP8MBY6_9BACT